MARIVWVFCVYKEAVMADLVTVVDMDGNEARVSSKWLARWPEDFSPAKGESKTASAGSKKTGGMTKKEAENGA